MPRDHMDSPHRRQCHGHQRRRPAATVAYSRFLRHVYDRGSVAELPHAPARFATRIPSRGQIMHRS